MILFELLPFFYFCTLQFCKCDISQRIIGRGFKLLSDCRVIVLEYLKHDVLNLNSLLVKPHNDNPSQGAMIDSVMGILHY